MEILNTAYGYFQDALDWIQLFFGGLVDLNSAPIDAASGVSAVSAAFKQIFDFCAELVGKIGK